MILTRKTSASKLAAVAGSLLFAFVLLAFVLLAFVLLALGGCSKSSGSSSGRETEPKAGGGQQAGEQSIHLVGVNWVEGVAMTHVATVLLRDSLGMNPEMTIVSGNGTAFSSVAGGSSDVVMEAWLPVTHIAIWNKYKDQLTKIGNWYDRATGGLVVPTYTDIYSIEDLPAHRKELGGVIRGIEAGSANNRQFRQILKNRGIKGFTVQSSSSPATWAALQRAVNKHEPIVATAWKPHWIWGRFDLRYLKGAQTGQTPVFDDPDNIYMIARKDFAQHYPARVVQFFKNVRVPDEALNSLMQPFRPESGVSDKRGAAREWIQQHRRLVDGWVPPKGAAQSANQTTAR